MITKKQIKEFEDAIRNWKAIGDSKKDKEMVALYKKDRADLREVVSLVKRGQYADAGDMVWNLDTVVRDVVPKAIYKEITKQAGYNVLRMPRLL